MNSLELLDSLPSFLREYLHGSEPEWIVPPFEQLGAGAWRFRISAAPEALVAIKVPGSHHDELRINVGVAFEVPYCFELIEHVNRTNEKLLEFGRLFVLGDPRPCVVVMQEIVYGASLSFDFPPSMQNLLNITGRLGTLAQRCGSEVIERFGGRAFPDEADMMLTLF